ncbi:MAG: universal stress protein [Kofleriaceae bacterium]|nr:universal stress protein [Kofleriaceae bacterium]MCB9573336.1 universal stress protein [Kofleriaceae bacterium]
MSLRTIVVGVDFSSESELGCRQALAIARRSGARIVLVHAAAIPDPAVGLPDSMRGTADAYLHVLRDRVTADQHALAELNARFAGQGAEISQVVVDGFADDAIPAAARELGADLLVVGSRGRRGLSRLLLGSVAERIVRAAEVPVLIARGAADAADGGFRRILVATDFSPAGEPALDVAFDVAAEGATIDLVHWWQVPSLSRAHAAEEVDATVAEIRAGVIEHGRRRAEESIALRDDASVTIAWHLREGDPQDGIQDWATGHDNDLIVVGSHGRRGLRRLILGSTAEATVRHATCSVLVARARPDDDAATPPHDTPS